jgi:hypothetical protein
MDGKQFRQLMIEMNEAAYKVGVIDGDPKNNSHDRENLFIYRCCNVAIGAYDGFMGMDPDIMYTGDSVILNRLAQYKLKSERTPVEVLERLLMERREAIELNEKSITRRIAKWFERLV